MEVQHKILSKIKKDTNDLLLSQIFPSISELIEVKMREETDKFFKKTNILGDMFPKPSEYHGHFSFCGACDLCNGKYHSNEGIDNIKWKEDCINSISTVIDEHSVKLYDDEYILLCSRRYIYDNNSNYYYSNYGRLCWTSQHNGHLYITSEKWLNRCVMYGNNGHGGRAKPVLSEHFNKEILLTIEYINLLNTLDLTNYNKDFDYHLFNKLIHVYRSFNPKASDIYRIEKKKEEVEKIIQNKETKIVNDEKLLSEKQKEFTKDKEKFKKEKEDFEKDKQIHKQKSKNLLKRENDVFIKESIKSVHEELNDISYSLSDVIDLLDDIDPIIEQRLNQTIQKLSSLFGVPVIEAVEVQ